MKVLVYGDASPASGGWCYAETLRDMGYEVLSVPDPDGLGHHRSLGYRLYRRVFGQLRESDRLRYAQVLKSEVGRFRPSVVIVQKGLHLSHEDIQSLRQMGCWVCNINHDDFFSLNPNNRSRIQRRAIPAYDYIFTTREVNVKEVEPLNPRVEFFPFAYFPRIHRTVEIPADEKERWAADVVFVGTYERPRAEMLEHIVRQMPVRLAIHGTQWSKISRTSPLRPCLKSTGLRFDDLAKALRGAHMALGFLRKENRDDYTQRTFEIPACDGVLLAERTKRHLHYYQEGVEAEFFDPESPAELCEKVSLLLSNPERREQIRQAGQTAVLKGHHTYKDRLLRLLDVYGQQR